MEALLLYIEIEKSAPIIEEMIPLLSSKQPKIIAANLTALTSIFNAYGVKIVDPKPVIKTLPKMFGHSDKNVRAEASKLVAELYRWLREAMKPLFWNDLKPVQQQDLEKLFDGVKQEESPKQARLLRSQQAAIAKATDVGEDIVEEADEADDEPAQVDAFDLAEPQDVYHQMPEGFLENMASTKWKDRKEALDALFVVANVPRIKDGPFDEVVITLAKSMKDANVMNVTVAANCIEVLAKGLRKSFAKYRSRILSPMLERLKEKKQAVSDGLGAALDAVFSCTGLSENLEDIFEYMKNKNPQIKLETVKFLIRCLKTTREPPSKAETKSIAEAGTKLLTESTDILRNGGAEILGTLMKIMGERQMNQYLEGLDDIRKTKIKEYFDTAVVKAKDKPKPVAPPPKAAPPPQKRPVVKKPATGVIRKPALTPRAVTPSAEEPPPEPPKSAARSIPSKLGGPPKSGMPAPSGGLKLQKRLAGPGGPTASPKRTIATPDVDDEPAPIPKLGLGGRGLAGRPLGKPTPAPPEPAPAPTLAGMTAIEREEMDFLRTENSRLQHLTDDLRASQSKLASQINELQNQNAQLIEDHTRDVLSIKAKETQLVRARSDAEAAEQTVQKQQREMERLKRELSRAMRAESPAPPSYTTETSDHIYNDTSINSSAHYNHPGMERYNSNRSIHEPGPQRGGTRSYMHSPSEEKENGGLEAGDAMKMRSRSPPPQSHSVGGGIGYGLGIGSGGDEQRGSTESLAPHHRNTRNGISNSNGSTDTDGAPIESWRRAAEVTSQLKARIEQMKVRPWIIQFRFQVHLEWSQLNRMEDAC